MDLFEEKIKPMLAFPSGVFNSNEWLFEEKFDGTRCIAYVDKEKKSVKMLNRRMIFFEKRYPEFQDLWKHVNAKKVILDGEIVVLKNGKPDFYLLEEREHVEETLRVEILSELNPATYFIFDILYLNGKDLTSLPLIERKKFLKEVVEETERIKIVKYVIGEGKKLFEEVKKKGFEGIVAKKIDSVYEIGKRSKNWLKIKFLKTLDAIICGYTKGEGWREKYFGALLLGIWDKGKLRYIGRVGTGWSEDDLKEITEKLKKLEIDENPFDIFEEEKLILEKVRFVKPKLVCEVKFMELTKDKKLRAPSFVRLREDKLSKDCILEYSKKI
ncbi:MAG TPA: DNA ligase [Candidatus Aenigmarchaeota archaeon]|nr:DNA ligase [Candidatus Aenigmarchaeota archaeon]